jgi:hypothetical protein
MVVTLALTLYWLDAMIADIARLWWGPLAVNYLTMVCIWGTMYFMDSIAQPFSLDDLAQPFTLDGVAQHQQGTVIAWESGRVRPCQLNVPSLERKAS